MPVRHTRKEPGLFSLFSQDCWEYPGQIGSLFHQLTEMQHPITWLRSA